MLYLNANKENPAWFQYQLYRTKLGHLMGGWWFPVCLN
jgi:hypothetical protein